MNETRTVAASTLETWSPAATIFSTPAGDVVGELAHRDPGGGDPRRCVEREVLVEWPADGRHLARRRHGGGRRSTTSKRRMTGRRRDSEPCRQRRVELVGPTEHPAAHRTGRRRHRRSRCGSRGLRRGGTPIPGPRTGDRSRGRRAGTRRSPGAGTRHPGRRPGTRGGEGSSARCTPTASRGPPGPAPGAARRVSRRWRSRRRRRPCRPPAGTACRTGSVAPIRHRATR